MAVLCLAVGRRSILCAASSVCIVLPGDPEIRSAEDRGRKQTRHGRRAPFPLPQGEYDVSSHSQSTIMSLARQSMAALDPTSTESFFDRERERLIEEISSVGIVYAYLPFEVCRGMSADGRALRKS